MRGGGAWKQPIKQPTEMPTSTMALMVRFPSLMGRFPTLMGHFPDSVLRGRFASWKSTGKQPIQKRGIKRFLIMKLQKISWPPPRQTHDRSCHNRRNRQNRHCHLLALYFVGQAKGWQGVLQNRRNRHEGSPPKLNPPCPSSRQIMMKMTLCTHRLLAVPFWKPSIENAQGCVSHLPSLPIGDLGCFGLATTDQESLEATSGSATSARCWSAASSASRHGQEKAGRERSTG